MVTFLNLAFFIALICVIKCYSECGNTGESSNRYSSN